VNVVIGFAPLKPAEFIILTISTKAGQRNNGDNCGDTPKC
jgi:hypothetical protein